MSVDRHSRRWLAVTAVAGLILLASILPLPESTVTAPGNVPISTTALHGIGYFALAGTLAFALANRWPSSFHVALVGTLGATLYGLGIEGLQGFVPTRTPSLTDGTVNGLGAVLGSAVWWFRVRLVSR